MSIGLKIMNKNLNMEDENITTKENKVIKYRIIGEIKSLLSIKDIVNFNGVKIAPNYLLVYNYPDSKLYIVYSDIINELYFNKEEIIKRVHTRFEELLSTDINLVIKENKLELKGELVNFSETDNLIIEDFSIKGYLRLSDIVNNSGHLNIFEAYKVKEIYELFLVNPLMLSQLKEYCKFNKIEFDENADSVAKLPGLQLFVEEINEVYILDKIVKYFMRYFASAYLLTIDLENKDDLATLILVDKKFGSYVVEELKTGIDNINLEVFNKELEEVLNKL
jgi:hypothetical protein